MPKAVGEDRQCAVCVCVHFTHMCTLVCDRDIVFWPQEMGEASGGLVCVWPFGLQRNLHFVEMIETYQSEDEWVNRWVAGVNTL